MIHPARRFDPQEQATLGQPEIIRGSLPVGAIPFDSVVAPDRVTQPPSEEAADFQEILRAFASARAAVKAEVLAVRSDVRNGAVAVGAGVRLDHRYGRMRYCVPCGDQVRGLRKEEAVGYEVGNRIIPGTVVGVQDSEIVLEVERDLGGHIEPGAILRDTAWLWCALDRRLAEIEADIALLGVRTEWRYPALAAVLGMMDLPVVEANPDPWVWRGDPLDAEQKLAVLRSLASRYTLIWGPPGTGKTVTLARIVEAHVRMGHRVLLLAGSNRGVDVALTASAQRLRYYPGYGDGLLLRWGSAESVELTRTLRDELLVRAVVQRRLSRRASADARVSKQIDGLRKVLAELDREERLYLDPTRRLRGSIRRCLQKLERSRAPTGIPVLAGPEQLDAATDAVLRECRVLATTVAQTCLSPRIRQMRWDVVIVDEASQLSGAALLAVATLGNQLIIAGDFRQTGPIARSRSAGSERWLRTDPFSLRGVPGALARGDDPAYLTMLRTQWRCAEPICRLYGPAYFNLLATHQSVSTRPGTRYVLGKNPLLRLDSTGYKATVKRVGTSRLNVVHVSLVAEYIRGLIRTGRVPGNSLREIAVIAPFEAQVTAHYSALRRICGSDMPRVGTIHAIQGDAAEVVILDLTDAAGLELSHFFGSCHRYEDEGARLLTVALSRARCHVVLVADYGFMLEVSPPGPIAHRIVRHFWRSARPIDLNKLRLAAAVAS